MKGELVFRCLAFSLLVAMKLIRRRTHRRSDQHGQREALRQHRIDSMLLFVLGTVWNLSIAIYALAPQWIDWSGVYVPLGLRVLGALLGAAALCLLAWSDHHLGRNFSPTLRIRADHALVTSGPYRWVRHPIYTSGLLFSVAFFLVTANGLVGLCWAGTLVLYGYRIPREEAMMVAAFGDPYRDYIRQTGAVLPRLRFRGLVR